jgi:hypothetical protein
VINGDILKNEISLSVDYKQLYEQSLVRCSGVEVLVAALRKEKRVLELRDAPIPNRGYEWLTNLQYKVKSLTERVKAFESGKKYLGMKAKFKALLDAKDNIIRKLKDELAKANTCIVTVRENWLEVIADMEKAHAKQLNAKDSRIKILWNRVFDVERQRDEYKDKYLEKAREVYDIKTELEEEKEKNLKLKAQINRNHENSSVSSSLKPNKKKIINTRVKSGKKPGGQPGHKHHPRKKQIPTTIVEIPIPEEYADDPNYVTTGITIIKQLIEIQVNLKVTEYQTPELRDNRTGTRVHAEFPGELTDDVTYGGSVKGLAFLLNSFCNVSIGKVSDFICELTDGKLRISTGMICGLTKEFSNKTQADQKKAFADMLLEPVMHTDFTSVRVNGKNMNAIVCATPDKVQYYAREHKGHKGIKGTPVETYQHTLVHDHDKTFYNYGGNHQDCNDHVLRYLLNSIENEPNLKWNINMRELIQEMIHFRKHLDPEDMRNPDEIDPEKVATLEARYDELLDLAKTEYEYEPPSKYYMDGYNLYKRLYEYKGYYLLFLNDRRVPHGNSLSERLLRNLKRKAHQVMSFRSFEGVWYLCNCLGMIATLRANEENLYESTSAIFDRQIKGEATFI